MKRMQKTLRVWMASISLGGFLGGWVLLAHAPKPASSNSTGSSVAPLATLAPLPPVGANTDGSQFSQQSGSMPSFQSRAFLPVLRTHGS
jgi:hypothetical protein